MIKNCIFDLGNVMVTYHAKNYLQSKFQEPALCDFLYEHIFGSPEWLMLDEGTMKESQLIEQLIHQYPTYRNEILHAFDHWDDSLVLKNDSFAFAQSLKQQGFNLYILSNIQSEVYQRLIQRYPKWSELFTGAIISAEVKMIKPNPDIYTLCLNTFHLHASECLFFDDTYENIESAKKLGIHAIWFQDLDEVKEQLRTLQIFI